MATVGNNSALQSIRPLVVGTKPLPGECLSSLLVRACEANIFAKPSHLLDLVGLRAQASEFVPFTHAGAAPNIAKLLGTSAEAIESHMHPPVEDELGRTSVQWFGSSIERRHLEASVRRFAPHSLEEGQHYPAIWMVRLLDYCPITMEFLISDCPQCLRPLGWRACRFLSKCEKCGATLLSAQSRILPPHLHEAARLGAALVSPIAAVRQAALSSLPEPFSTWSPADALVGLLTLGKADISLRSTSNIIGTDGSAACIAAGIAFAKDWPHSLSRFAKASTVKSNSTSVWLGLGMLGRLFESATQKTPISILLRSTISASLAEAVVPAKLHRGGIVDSTCRTGRLSALEAGKQLGICLKTLRRLEGRSDTFLVRQNVKGGAALYDRTAISRLAAILSKSVRSNICARQLGIPRYCIQAFISTGLLERETDPDAIIVTDSLLISCNSIAKLRARLRKQSNAFEGGVTLQEAMRRNGDPYDWATVFNKMLSGHIRLEIVDRECSSLADSLIVSVTDIAHFVSRRCAGPGINGVNVCCQTAGNIIGTTQQFVSAAVKIGFINGEMGKRNSAIPLEAVLNFQKRFVLNEELCEKIGGNRKRIGGQLRVAGYKPAAIINRTRIWQRADIAKYIEEQKAPAVD